MTSWILVFVFVGVVPVVSIRRLSRRGPAISGWIPRRWRAATNTWYRRHGWEEPYDESGGKRKRYSVAPYLPIGARQADPHRAMIRMWVAASGA